MPENAFLGWPQPPRPADVRQALGKFHDLWQSLVGKLETEFGLTAWEWNSYSPKAGWSMRAKQGKRNILYLVPQTRAFQAVLILGGKAMEAARASKPTKKITAWLDAGQRYPEGTALRADIRTTADVEAVLKLTSFKLM
ncbi:MAG: DUF3788 family protein [Bryobacterales bacterium]|nr:DUF3788 family protein [Bryobacterales bacterium]